jgi:hypothetical protein
VAGQQVTFVLNSSWTTGTKPKIPWAMEIMVTCEEVIGLP